MNTDFIEIKVIVEISSGMALAPLKIDSVKHFEVLDRLLKSLGYVNILSSSGNRKGGHTCYYKKPIVIS